MSNPNRDALIAWLRNADNVVVSGHVSPDGDTSGCVIAMTMALRGMGKRAVGHLPGGLAKMYEFLPHADMLCDDLTDLPFEPKCALAIDVSDPMRMGDGWELFQSLDNAVIDHHGTNSGFGGINLIDGTRAAAGEMILELLESMDVSISKDMASWLYVAVSTDSGHFSYNNTTGNTLRAAAKCVECGAESDFLTKMLYRTRTKARTLLLGKALNDIHFLCDGKIAYACLNDEILQSVGATREDNEGIVNYLLEIDCVQVAILADQRGSAMTKFSLRSEKGWNVACDIAKPLGGGGHECAAGLTLDLPLNAALEAVLEKARAMLEA